MIDLHTPQPLPKLPDDLLAKRELYRRFYEAAEPSPGFDFDAELPLSALVLRIPRRNP